jgi:hypothetical protein
MCKHTYNFINTHIYINIHTHPAHTHILTHTHTQHTHTHTHTHTYMYMLPCLPWLPVLLHGTNALVHYYIWTIRMLLQCVSVGWLGRQGRVFSPSNCIVYVMCMHMLVLLFMLFLLFNFMFVCKCDLMIMFLIVAIMTILWYFLSH